MIKLTGIQPLASGKVASCLNAYSTLMITTFKSLSFRRSDLVSRGRSCNHGFVEDKARSVLP